MTLGVQATVFPVGSAAPDPRMLRPGWRNGDKPRGGLWTSTFTPDDDEHVSDWIRWCSAESYGVGEHDVWLLEPLPDAHVYTIDGCADLDRLYARFPPHDEPGVPMRLWSACDWEAIAGEYDAVRLTLAGHCATRMNFSRSVEAPNTYSWDCESTCWFAWKFHPTVRKHGTITITEYDWDDA